MAMVMAMAMVLVVAMVMVVAMVVVVVMVMEIIAAAGFGTLSLAEGSSTGGGVEGG